MLHKLNTSQVTVYIITIHTMDYEQAPSLVHTTDHMNFNGRKFHKQVFSMIFVIIFS